MTRTASTYLFEQIIPDGEVSERYTFEGSPEDEKQLGPLGKINIFVGPNNSGKSRLLRSLAATEKVTGTVQPATWSGLESFAETWKATSYEAQRTIRQMEERGCRDVNGFRSRVERLAGLPRMTEGHENFGGIFRLVDDARQQNRVISFDPIKDAYGADEALGAVRKLPENILNLLQKHPPGGAPSAAKLYIPVLRSLRDLNGANPADLLADCTKRAYFPQAKQLEIFTGQTLYNDVEELTRGNLEQRQTLRRFEAWVGESFFEGKPVALIPRKKSNVLFIKIGDEIEKPIHDLGDGIQSLLIITFPLFSRANEHVLGFIEEPELFLHPWLQRVLLEVLSSSRFPRQQYFLTTHSNHFLDLTIDIDSVSVFTFEKDLEEGDGSERMARFSVRNVSREERRPLELLGVRNSSVLLSNCTIWVEGITDRRYLARWLELYQIHKYGGETAENRAHFFKEDLHYSFVEYGGGNVVHWSFLDETGPDVERLCGTLFLIADSDGAAADSTKAKRHKTLQRVLGKRFHRLEEREIENLLTPPILRAILLSYDEVETNLQAVDQKDYKEEGLGTFMETRMLINPKAKVRTASYAGSSGTVNTKVEFCSRALKHTAVWDSLSVAAQTLTRKLYKFIEDNNQRGTVKNEIS